MNPIATTTKIYTIGSLQFVAEGDLWHQLSYRTAAEVLRIAIEANEEPTTIEAIINTPCFIPVTCEGKTLLVYSSSGQQFPIQWWEEVSSETLETLTALQVEGSLLALVRDIKKVR